MHKADEEKQLFEEQNILVHTRAGEITKKRLQAQSLSSYKKMKTELVREMRFNALTPAILAQNRRL